MSAAAIAEVEVPREPEPEAGTDVELLQDVLYDMLATGIDADAKVTAADIESFLHEHAREAKSQAEFREFFEQHGLRVDGVNPDSAILELPPITTVREPPRVDPIELALTDIEEIPWEAPKPPPTPLRAKWARPSSIALGAFGIALLLVAWRGYVMIHELRSDLSQASERHQRDHNALERLSDQAASLESSVAATGELIQRVDQKSDLLLDTLVPTTPTTTTFPTAPSKSQSPKPPAAASNAPPSP